MATETIETWPGYREIPAHINITREVLDRQLEAGLGERTAFVFDGGSISYAELGLRVNSLARGLLGLGIEKGARVLIRLPNCLEFAISFLALVKIGAIPVLQNSLLGPEEVAYVRGHSEAIAAITLGAIAEPLRGLTGDLPQGLIVARGAAATEHSFEQLIAENAGDLLDCVDTDASEPAFFVYTSGTTGRPKGIVHAHRWVIALRDTNKLRLPPRDGDVAMVPDV